MSAFLLGLWFALMGADRVDLLGGAWSYALTPFYALTPIVAAAELGRHWRIRRRVALSRGVVVYMASVAALLTIALISTVLSLQVDTAAPRALLLGADVVGTLLVATLCVDRLNLPRVFATGAMFGIALFVICDVRQLLWWVGRGAELMRIGPVTVHFNDLQSLGLIPRLSGLVNDANRAGYLLLVYLFVIARGETRPWRRRTAIGVCIFLMLFTFSRSTFLAGIAMFGVAFLSKRRPVTLRRSAAAMLALSAACVLFLLKPHLLDVVGKSVSGVVESRLTPEVSTTGHLALIQRGFNETGESASRTLIGLGYGNSYLVLQDVFPGNRYGNFHSLYVSMFAEAGVFALLLVLLMLATPLVMGGRWRPVIAAGVAFNVFYQTTTEPMFWFTLALAWLTFPVARRWQTRAVAASDSAIP